METRTHTMVYTRVDLDNTITIEVKAIQCMNGNAVAILPNVYR